MAMGIAHLDSVTHTPSIKSNEWIPLGSVWETMTAMSAFAARWSSRNFGSHPSLQFLVRLDSHSIVPQYWCVFRTILTADSA
jgi:hypothetical protein